MKNAWKENERASLPKKREPGSYLKYLRPLERNLTNKMDTFGAVFTAIENKFKADPTLVALLGGSTGKNAYRLYNKRAVEDPKFPYVVVFITHMAPDDTFTEEGEILNIQFNIYGWDEDSPDDDSTVNAVYSALDNLFNKCTLIVTGYHFVYMLRGPTIPVPNTDDTQQITVNYEIMIQEN